MIRVRRRVFLRSSAFLLGGSVLAACSSPNPARPTNPSAVAPQTAGTAVTVPSLLASPGAASLGVSPIAPAVASPGGAPFPVRGAWVALAVEQMIYALALEAGYFAKYGIDFDLSYINQSANGIAGIEAHSLDMITGGAAAVVSAQSGGADVLVAWSFIGKSLFRVMASADIATMDDLKGKTATVGKVGASIDYFLWLALIKSLGWSPDDLTIVNGGDNQGQIALLGSGQVQAMLIEPPADLQAEAVGAHQVFDTGTVDIPYAGGATMVARDFLAQDRQTVLNAAKACVEAVHRWKVDPDFTQAIIQKYLKPADPRYSQEGWAAFKDALQEAPLVSREGMRSLIQQVAAQTPQAADLDVDRTFDNSIVQELVDTGFVKQLYGA